MLFYHFTGRLWLPSIMQEGLNRGELPIDPDRYAYDQAKAVNLTTNPDPIDNMRIWGRGTLIDKSKIRIAVELPESEVTTFRQIRERFEVREKWLKIMAPYEERKRWFYVFGTIPPSSFAHVAIREGRQYRELPADELQQLVAAISEELDRAFVIGAYTAGRLKGAAKADFRNGVETSWLCDAREAFEELGIPFN